MFLCLIYMYNPLIQVSIEENNLIIKENATTPVIWEKAMQYEIFHISLPYQQRNKVCSQSDIHSPLCSSEYQY